MTAKKDEERLNVLIERVLRGMKPPEKLTVSEWADKKRKLSPESSAETGSWRTSRTPYLKEPMDAFCDPKVRHIVVVSSSQVGKSETINNMLGYIIDQDPGSILFVHPTTVDAKEYSKLRIAPMIRDSKALRDKVADAKSRDSGNTILQKSYPGGILTLCGSTEAHALASKPIRYIFGDERDRWAASAGNEGDPWDLATARQITFYNAKSVEVSTPTVKGASVIERAYNEGTMERWKTKCPHCGAFNEIVFGDIRFEKEETVVNKQKQYKLTSLFYVCPSCGGISDEATMKRMESRWEADNPSAYEISGTRSFWLSSWISPWASWESTIMMYLKAIGNTKRMQVVFNTRFGLLWEDRGDMEDEDSVMSRREDYDAELPDGVLMLTCGIDTQDDRVEYEVVGHGHFGETWGIKKGIIMGRPDTDAVWESIDDLLSHVFRFGNGVGLRLSLTFMDEGGHFTQDVRRRCRDRQSLKIFPIKGRGGENIPYTSPPKAQKIVVNGRTVGTCKVFEIGVDAGKSIIMDNIRVKEPGAKYCHFPRRDDYGAAYFTGLLSERLTYEADKKQHWQWKKIPGHERNEVLDCRNYALAAAKAMDTDYDALDLRLKQAAERIAKHPGRAVGTETVTSVKPAQPVKTAKRKVSAKDKHYDEW